MTAFLPRTVPDLVHEARTSGARIPFGLPETVLAVMVFLVEFGLGIHRLEPASVLGSLAGVLLVAAGARWPLAVAVLSVPYMVLTSYFAGSIGSFSFFFVVILLELVTAGGLTGVGLILVPVHTAISVVDFSVPAVYFDPMVLAVLCMIFGAGHLVGRTRLLQQLANARLRASLAQNQRAQRLSLARELHDSVATSLTSVVMRSQTLELTSPEDTCPDVRDGLEDIARTSRDALEQLRTMLRLLNSETDLSTRTTGVPPTVREALGTATRELRAHGQRVRTSFDLPRVTDTAVSVETREALSRILTEMASNAVKHSPDRAVVRLGCTVRGDTLTVTMENPVAPAPEPATDPALTSHLGMGSMSARAEAVGGEVTAGPAPQVSGSDLWRTTVSLPIVENGT